MLCRFTAKSGVAQVRAIIFADINSNSNRETVHDYFKSASRSIKRSSKGQAAQAAQAAPVEQAAQVQQVQPMNTAPAVAQAYAPAPVAAAPLSMDSADVASVGSVTEFIKLGDGGLKLGDGKFGATKFKTYH